MKQSIALKHRNSIVVPNIEGTEAPPNPAAAALVSNMMTLGYIPTDNLFKYLNILSTNSLVILSEDIIPELRRRKGADVAYEPMYPNFPQQVMNMSYCELFFNAVCHYWSFGNWEPDYDKLPRKFAFENTQFKAIDLIDHQEFCKIFDSLFSSRESISEGDKKAIEWFLIRSNIPYEYKGDIPFKENLCFIASVLLDKGMDISPYISTATDLLRVCTALSGGDISLAENTKFISFPRWLRRLFMGILDKVANEEDIERHRGKWIRLFHSFHASEYPGKAADIAKKIRSGDKIHTFHGLVEKALSNGDYEDACSILKGRPGEFARRLDHLMRLAAKDHNYKVVFDGFYSIIDRVPTRILLGILGNLKVRGYNRDKRIVFPKGSITRATVLRKDIPAMDKEALMMLTDMIQRALRRRFATLDPMGKCWISSALANCPLPTAMRSASEGLVQVARGTRLPIGDDKTTLRFFIYWVGQDIDLSATLHDENFKTLDHISYTRLKSHEYEAYHSGDIVEARNGASEFIDITMDKALRAGVRYVAMNVLVYNGPSFREHKTVYAGWMTRSKPNSNEIYDPKTVENKIDLASNARNSIPVLFDLKERTAIWADLTTMSRTGWNQAVDFGGGISAVTGGNNVEANRASIAESVEAMISLENKITLAELFALHVKSRGELVESPDEAETIFSMRKGITPFDIAKINSEFIK